MRYTLESKLSNGFSIIEVMIGIFVFSLWLVAIFALLTSSLSINDKNKNSIIAWQLARQQVELIRNIRDTNYKNLKLWNQHDPYISLDRSDIADPTKVFLDGNYYFLSTDYSTWEVSVEHLWDRIPEWKSDLWAMNAEYGLCFDNKNRYIKCSWSWTDDTNFFRYISIMPIQDDSWNIIEDAYMVLSKVIWYKRWYHELEIKTILTDWRRI